MFSHRKQKQELLFIPNIFKNNSLKDRKHLHNQKHLTKFCHSRACSLTIRRNISLFLILDIIYFFMVYLFHFNSKIKSQNSKIVSIRSVMFPDIQYIHVEQL